MSERELTLEILRYDPAQDQQPWIQEYSVPCGEDWAILDALIYIKEELDSTLSFRWSCHMMVCGSCGMMINGEPSLTCKLFVRDLPDRVRIEPLANFPIERDLVIVLDDFMSKLQKVEPYLIRQEPQETPANEAEEFLQAPSALQRFKQYTMCINCMACYAACPQYGLEADFIGPAALALAHRYNLDSRDQGRRRRITELADHDGIWNCSFVGACSEVCPKDVDPAAAIQQMKLEAVTEWLRQKLPGSKAP